MQEGFEVADICFPELIAFMIPSFNFKMYKITFAAVVVVINT